MKALIKTSQLIFVALLLISITSCATPSPAKEGYERGIAFVEQGNLTKAKMAFEAALRLDPSHRVIKFSLVTINEVLSGKIAPRAAIHLIMGTYYRSNRKYDQAIREYTGLVRLNPKNAMSYVKLGDAHMKKGWWVLLGRRYDKAAHEQASLHFDLGHVNYIQALKINPRLAEAYRGLGSVYDWAAKYDRAIAYFTRAIELNPKYATAYNNRGFVYLFRLKNKVEGCANYKKACELGNCWRYKKAKRKGVCQ